MNCLPCTSIAAPDAALACENFLAELIRILSRPLTQTRPKVVMTRCPTRSRVVKNKFREVAMEQVQRYRAMGSLCRQHAAYNPTEAWKLLAEAERWEHLAVEAASHLKESNMNRAGDISKSGPT